MATASLSAAARTGTGKGTARSLRKAGRIPGVVYGHARQPQPLSCAAREFERLLSHINAETTVIDLSIDGVAARTLIREIQRHPLDRSILHVDFQELVAGEKVTVNVPIVLVGVPVGVRMSGAIMTQILFELEVRVDPADIPGRINAPVEDLAIGHSLHVSDLSTPAGVEVLTSADDTVVIVAAPKEEVVATPAVEGEGEAPAEPEVIGKARPEEEVGEKK